MVKEAFGREDFALECLRTVTIERDIAVHDHAQVEAENENLVRSLRQSEDALRQAKEARDTAIHERDQTINERDQAVEQRDNVLSRLHTANKALENADIAFEDLSQDYDWAVQAREACNYEREQAQRQLAVVWQERDTARLDHEEAINFYNVAVGERNTARQERDIAMNEREAAVQECNAIRDERDVVMEELRKLRAAYENKSPLLDQTTTQAGPSATAHEPQGVVEGITQPESAEEVEEAVERAGTQETEDEDEHETDEDSSTINADSDGLGADSAIHHELYNEEYEWL